MSKYTLLERNMSNRSYRERIRSEADKIRLHFWLNIVSNLWLQNNFHFEATYTICNFIEPNLYYFSIIFFTSGYILLERYWQIRGDSQDCNKIYQEESYSTHNYSEGVGNTVQKPEGKYKGLSYIRTNNWFSGS